MRILMNILWFIFGGFIYWLGMVLAGIIFYITIIGIPFGHECFKLASLGACPFGKKVVYNAGFVKTLANVLWILLVGWESALTALLIGAVLCVTIIGIPFGKQFFKIAAVSFLPFGAEVTVEHVL